MHPALAKILGRRRAYRSVFRLEDGKPQGSDAVTVLADLRRFCCADQPTTRVSPITRQIDVNATLIAEGRREVWLRLMAHLHMDDSDIARLQEFDEART